jgi:hypothetical protein
MWIKKPLSDDYLFFMWQEKSFDEYKSVGSAWHKDSMLPSIQEWTLQNCYDLFINVRDNNDYQFNNLF